MPSVNVDNVSGIAELAQVACYLRNTKGADSEEFKEVVDSILDLATDACCDEPDVFVVNDNGGADEYYNLETLCEDFLNPDRSDSDFETEEMLSGMRYDEVYEFTSNRKTAVRVRRI